ncbi:DNA polymerase delta subunit 4-like [Phoenix dactylifera]|uniref:DNA polymerase delta subunit 4-like n=1 Tax=Phoenix dactylifera TaxID=42345 RepID=A0A8B7MV73_PHODC|nr:DNA polymerase delta subunit 4-like [Phoenix dactylifera]
MASGDIQGFYRQRKKGGAASSSSAKKKSGKPPDGGATLGADAAQNPFLISHGSPDLQDDYGPEEEKLRQFDMDMRYGPCLGLTRLQRWERAAAMGLHPPPDLGELLRHVWQDELRRRSAEPKTKPNPALECLWEGRV